ncbi:MAG: histidine kinase [Lysobacter sp.]|nr:histidine kinase [Lysobacter sp.]
MSATLPPLPPALPPPLLGWRRVRFILIAAFVSSLLMKLGSQAPYLIVLLRMLVVGFCALLTFGVLERWPARLPRWSARWALQVVGVAATIPLASILAYTLTTADDPLPWWQDKLYLAGLAKITVYGLLVAPWMAIAALLRQIRGEAQRQALAFELERSRYERNALDARLRLLQAQVEPHFLFNTLANVRELVQAGSPQASSVLDSLIAYLRAAVPRLHGPAATLAQELDLVRAYLEVMHMRMPDRLQYALHADPATLDLDCPPMTLLTLVENAVRHGIDPSEEGGRIEVRASLRDGHCRLEVADTGVGLGASGDGLGTGLANLRERLQLAHGDRARLSLIELQPHGVLAQIEFPAQRSAA